MYSGIVPLGSNSEIAYPSVGNSDENSYGVGTSIIFGWILCWIKAWMGVRKKPKEECKSHSICISIGLQFA